MKGKNLEEYCNVAGFEEITFGELVNRWGDIYGNKIAIKDKDEEVTYWELMKKSQELVGVLKNLGIREKSIVALQCTNRICFIEILFALFRMGTVPIMVLPAYREQEVIKVMQKTNADAYIGPIEYMGYSYKNIETEIKRVIPEVITLLIDKNFTDAENLIVDEYFDDKNVVYDDVAILLLSGGTTGEPKLIPRTHADYIYNAKMAAERSCLDQQSVYLAALSIAHNMPLACPGILGTLYAGGTVILSYYSSPDEIMELIEEEGVTITGLVPTLAQLCMELLEIDEFDISSLKVIITGGARLEAKLAEDIIRNFHCILQNQFGTAEGLVMSTSLNDPVEWTLKYQGKPISEADRIRIIDEEGKDVPEGQSGELIVRGLYTIENYYNEPQCNTKFTDDGYYRTGDRAVITIDGNVRVLGRMKEQINRAGEKIQPSEIEESLLELREVQQTVVIAIDDPLLGQKSCAFVQFRPGCNLDEKEICSKLQQKGIVRYKIPDQIEVIEEWPVTKIGKIDINTLKRKASIK
ncbi:2,3-dihydroxybenzoate-AMP ligase [Clostridiales bacterium CHKCI001]|nr:2,3-dihydroxybenzoate-AMP ligase [Clostridiales bacterium CHKCI001]